MNKRTKGQKAFARHACRPNKRPEIVARVDGPEGPCTWCGTRTKAADLVCHVCRLEERALRRFIDDPHTSGHGRFLALMELHALRGREEAA